jgi:hypothetical protein
MPACVTMSAPKQAVKKPKTVIAAEAALSAKAAEVAAARDALKRLEAEHGAAYAAVRQAQTDADAALPQCRVVRVRWRNGNEEDAGRVVIVRRTPGGVLVVRHVGAPAGHEYKFKWSEHSHKFRRAECGGYNSDTSEPPRPHGWHLRPNGKVS